jgi:hypothetical protein
VPGCEDQNFTPSVTAFPSSIGLFGTALPKMLIDCADTSPPHTNTTSKKLNNDDTA